LSCAAGVLAARGESKLTTITLLTTMLDFTDTGDIGLLIDKGSVALQEATIGRGGILPGKELAFTFGTLRANDLIWRYVVDSYLKGATPDAFDRWNVCAGRSSTTATPARPFTSLSWEAVPP
jgi:polyhydroxyalkanoate synthase